MISKWNILSLTIIAVMLWTPTAIVSASEKPSAAVVESIIDQKISFYRERIYLANSSYNILADIGIDAVENIKWFTENKDRLVKCTMDHMAGKKGNINEKKVRNFLTFQLNAHRGVSPTLVSDRSCIKLGSLDRPEKK